MSWSDALNWSGDELPGSDDDVTINLASNPTVTFSSAAGNVSVHSLTSANPLSITGGSLTVRDDSTLNNSLSMTGGSLTATGLGTSLLVNGSTSVTGANLIASGGATLSLSQLTSYASTSSATIQASGAGSRLDLSGLTTLDGPAGFNTIQVNAVSGGVVDLHSLAQLDQGAVSFNADGANSLVDLSALTSFSTNGSYDSSIRVANGGEVRVNDGLTALNRVDLTLGLGTLKTVQLTSITNASLSVSESGVDLSGIGSLDGVSIYVSGGATLSLSQLTSYASTSSATIQASGAGSRLDLSGLTTLDGPAGFNTIQVNAVSGGVVDLHSLAQLDQGAVSFNADGANSLVDLSALTSFSTNGSYDSSIRVANGGEVRVNDGLTALNRVDLTLGLGTLKTVQLTSITNASLSVSESGVDLSGIGSLDGVSIYVSGGATLSLSQLTSYASTSSATIQASGAGSRLDLSGLTTLDGPAGFNTIQVNAVSGGVVDLHSLAKLDQGAVSFNADGANSLVDLSALTSFSTNGSYDSSIRVANGGEVRVNDGLTALNRVDLTLGLGTLKTVQLTSITNASLSVSESGVDLSGIGSLDGVSIYVSGGAMLSLSQLTSYASTSSATIQASGAGSRLDLSGLTTLDGPAGFNTIQVNAVSGGVVDLHSLAQLDQGAVSFNADGANSLVDLSALTSFSTNGSYDSSIRVANGGEVLLAPSATEVTRVDIVMSLGGVISGGALNLAETSMLSGTGTIHADLVNSGQIKPGATSGSLPKTGIL